MPYSYLIVADTTTNQFCYIDYQIDTIPDRHYNSPHRHNEWTALRERSQSYDIE